MTTPYDAVVIGSGPNGLAAAVALAQAGASVLVLEGHTTPGGGTRTAELTLPGFHHDVCSGCHPTGILSPFFRTLPLAEHGLRWAQSDLSFGHPLDEGPAAISWASFERTVQELGADGPAYRRLVGPLLSDPHGLLADAMGPLGLPKRPFGMARFGLRAWPSARLLAETAFRGQAARALVAGCATHAVQPLEMPLTAAMSLVFLMTSHVEAWPVAVGGSQAISAALVSLLTALGGEVRTGTHVSSLTELPPSKVVLFDTSPDQLAQLGGPWLPRRYVRRLGRYRYGPGSYKLDWALSGPIPWNDPRLASAATVHVGGTFDEIAAAERDAWEGRVPRRPALLVIQQSALDPTRAPEGQHTGYAYCHVPAGCTVDMTEAMEAQMERFAPGFRDLVLARHVTTPADFQAYNPNFVGGAVTGGSADPTQLFTRPVARANPYSTPNPRLWICSGSTPPGGGVHGMGGWHAAQGVLKRLPKLPAATAWR